MAGDDYERTFISQDVAMMRCSCSCSWSMFLAFDFSTHLSIAFEFSQDELSKGFVIWNLGV